MAENFTFYSQLYDAIPEENMRGLARIGKWLTRLFRKGPRFTIGQNDERGRTFVFAWPNVTLTCHETPAKKIPAHLDGFRGYVRSILGGPPDERGQQILDRIGYTRLVLGVVVEPGRDEGGLTENLLGAICNGLGALMFHGNALFDQDARLILAPDGSFDKEADVLGPVADMIKDRIQVEIPPGEPYQATAAQAARARRILDQLRQRKVPTLDSFLHVEDDEAVTLRKPREVARRVLVLSAVSFLADGGPRDAALEMIDHADLWPAVSPEEKDFLEATRTDPEKAHKLLWRLEALWVLAWALGDLDLDWPSGMCDVPRLVKHVETYEGREDFIAKATLRPKTQILDAQQLTLLIHWAITDAFVHHRSVPADLDWSGNSDMVPVTQAPAVAVVEERHRALNWLTCLDNADWDHVDTST